MAGGAALAAAEEDEGVEAKLEATIAEAAASLGGRQSAEGYWVFDLQADATIPAEYIMLNHYLDEVDPETEAILAEHIRGLQGDHGGWPLFHEGDFDMSCSVKAYLALKLVGDDPQAPHMRRAREAILAHGGAARSNVFTRIALALYGQVPWRAVPVMPVEIMLLPRWFPFHLSKVSYWSRTVIVPLLILMAHRPRARNPRGVDIRELFTVAPECEHHYFAQRGPVAAAFLGIDRVLRLAEPLFPKRRRERAIAAAMDFIVERLNGDDGLGAIFPAMAYTVMAFDCLGLDRDHPLRRTARRAVDKLLTIRDGKGFCQPCWSPVWDTGLAVQAMMEAGESADSPKVRAALDWLKAKQVLDLKGDWAERRPRLAPGGWAFQFANPHYPDIDDTSVVGMAMDRTARPEYDEAVRRAADWVAGMQSSNGGWGAFDVDNTHLYLNHIPFADHGALLDPPTADVTARCISFLCQIGYPRDHPVIERGLAFLRREQEDDGSWFGRWGTNYIYGTWSVLSAFNAAGEDPQAPHIRRAVAWLKSRQRDDGGWGEDGATYYPERRAECKASTPSQTAWALLGLMAAGEVESAAVRRGVDYLLACRREGDTWEEPHYTAVGFPRVFYLKYHGYAAYFPLWALARYRNLKRGNRPSPVWGM